MLKRRVAVKKLLIAALAAIMLMSSFVLASCGKSVFTMSENTEKAMTLEAKNAKPDDFFQVGTLVVGEGEQISITGNLEKGSVKLEIIGEPAEQSIDEVPDMDGEPVLTAEISGTDRASGGMAAGDYSVKATVTGKATGTIQIEVVPAE